MTRAISPSAGGPSVHRAVVLDGITIQHVGEVLFDAPVTQAIRGICRAAYVQSVEDFTFGVLFGERLTLSGTMPPVGDDTPGAVLIRDSALRGFTLALDIATPAMVGDLLTRVGLRASAEHDLTVIAGLPRAELEPFRPYYIREAHAYLGSHPSIFEPGLPGEGYEFSTPERASHYVRDASLQAVIPRSFATVMVDWIRQKCDVNGVVNDALIEFVGRVLVTHVANYWSFDYAARSHIQASARLPHSTRALIRKHADRVDDGTTVGRLVYRGIVPRALLEIIAMARDRQSFLDALRVARHFERFRRIREYLGELVHRAELGDLREAEELLTEIARRSREANCEPEPFSLSSPLTWEADEQRLNPGKYYVRHLIRDSSYAGESPYITEVAEFFRID